MEVHFNGHFQHFRNETICKDKWWSSNRDCKKINNYKDATNHNEDYSKMFVENRVTQGLPRNFNKSYFDLIDEFMHIKL